MATGGHSVELAEAPSADNVTSARTSTASRRSTTSFTHSLRTALNPGRPLYIGDPELRIHVPKVSSLKPWHKTRIWSACCYVCRSIAVVTLLGVLGIFQQSVAGQDRIGTLSGTVSDVSGTGISGALITASFGSFGHTVTTDSIGAFSLQFSPGGYRVRVTFKKFTPAEGVIELAATGPVVAV